VSTGPSVALDALADEKRWVAWRNELRGGKLTKVPYAADGKKAKADDPATWGIRAEAEAAATKLVNGQGGGVGIELGDLGNDIHLAGIDLDSCLSENDQLAPWAAAILNLVPSYTEVSPSGHGLKLFFYVASEDGRAFLDRIGAQPHQWGVRRDVPGEDPRAHGPAIEVYLSHRYFTVTGALWATAPNELAMLDGETLERLALLIPPARSGADRRDKGGGDSSRSAIAYRKGSQLHREGKSFEEMCEALRADPETATWYTEKGIASGMRELKRIWGKADSIVREPPYQVDPQAPFETARLFRDLRHTTEGLPTLHVHKGDFYAWSGVAYPELDVAEVRSRLYEFLSDECVQVVWDKEASERVQVPVKPNTNMVNNVLDGQRAATLLPATVEAAAWLDRRTDPEAGDVIACTNGLLHLPTLALSTYTPAFFTHNAVDFAFAPNAPEPRQWLQFLAELWPVDQAAIDTLQEMFGYCLTSDTSQQKMFLMVGPKRSGKGTIAGVLTRLVAPESVVAPTLAGLGTNFGLAPLIGKRVAIISDARLSGRADQAAIGERLLSITGEDGITIDRKYKDAWTGRLPVRFLILSNELPRLADSSGALASRFIVLVLTESFFGREDPGLTNKLMAELPGILNWAVKGWRRLRQRGFFKQPSSALEVVEELEDLGSPISAFLRDCCTIDPGQEVEPDTIFGAWSDWCARQGRDHPGTKQTFGRDLRAALPRLKTSQPREGGERLRFYQGLGLKIQPKPDRPPPEAVLARHTST